MVRGASGSRCQGAVGEWSWKGCRAFVLPARCWFRGVVLLFLPPHTHLPGDFILMIVCSWCTSRGARDAVAAACALHVPVLAQFNLPSTPRGSLALRHCHGRPATATAALPRPSPVLQEDLSVYPPDSDRQQAAVLAVADQDAFNWGYDPVHYGVPEGSYATQPDGTARCGCGRRAPPGWQGQGSMRDCRVLW